MTGSVGLYGSPMTIAREISSRIKSELGITASIGVANNKITAKLGSDYKKPDAITGSSRITTRRSSIPCRWKTCSMWACYLQKTAGHWDRHHRPAGGVPGGAAAAAPWENGAGPQYVRKGRDVSPVQKTDHIPNVKSVGNSATTPRDLVSEGDVQLMLLLLAESVCSRMRELASRCTVVEIYVRDTNCAPCSGSGSCRLPPAPARSWRR